MHRLLLVLFFATTLPLGAQAPHDPPVVDGYVTRAASVGDFDVNGLRIACTPKTLYQRETNDAAGAAPLSWTAAPRVGERLRIFGDRDGHTVRAREILLRLPSTTMVEGFGLIDRVLASLSPSSGELLVRADGYPVLITPKTSNAFKAPLTSLSAVGTNQWLAFKGEQWAGGSVHATYAVFLPNVTTESEAQTRSKAEYDPEKVDPADAQSSLSKAAIGLDLKRIPPLKDAAMQARITRVGESLIPEYQRRLPDSDPTKIHFRFHLIGEVGMRDAFTFPSGIILVPKDVVERMTTDAQLAAVLAGNIAYVLEKESYRLQPASHRLIAAEISGLTAGAFVPGLGPAVDLINSAIILNMIKHIQEQCDRESLALLHDAGYDLAEAPRSWWLLTPRKPKPLAETNMPGHAGYLYSVIGSTWPPADALQTANAGGTPRP